MALLQQRSPYSAPVPVPARSYAHSSRSYPRTHVVPSPARGTIMMHQPHAPIVRRVHTHAPVPHVSSRLAATGPRNVSRNSRAPNPPTTRPPPVAGRMPYHTMTSRYSSPAARRPPGVPVHVRSAPPPNVRGRTSMRRSMPARAPAPNAPNRVSNTSSRVPPNVQNNARQNVSTPNQPNANTSGGVRSIPPSPQRRPQQQPAPPPVSAAAAQGTHAARLAATVARAKSSTMGIPGGHGSNAGPAAAPAAVRGRGVVQHQQRGGRPMAIRGRPSRVVPPPQQRQPTPRQLATPVRNRTGVVRRMAPPTRRQPRRGPGRPPIVRFVVLDNVEELVGGFCFSSCVWPDDIHYSP